MFPRYLVKLKTTQKQPTASGGVLIKAVVRYFHSKFFSVCFKNLIIHFLKKMLITFCRVVVPISSVKKYRNYKNQPRNSKVIIENKEARFY